MLEHNKSRDRDAGGVWHPGEIDLQRRDGVVEKMAETGKRVIRDFMPDQHRAFFEKLPFIVVGSVDDNANAWAGLRTGVPGFLSSPAPTLLQISGAGLTDDPVEDGLKNGAPLGLLGIELATRRRNRLNGRVTGKTNDHIEIAVDQSFGNCPQYIQQRGLEPIEIAPGSLEQIPDIDDQVCNQILAADTFFVASYVDRPYGRQVDVSHRGGRAGFVRIEPDGALTIPDFSGNRFFATLGNILVSGRAGLTFVDFESGTLLQMTGRARVLDDQDVCAPFLGAERFWRFWPEQIVRRRDALPFRFRFETWSPRLKKTGSWSDPD